jgi:hypothetical protein
MKAWVAGVFVAWMVAVGGVLGFVWWGFSPVQRDAVRPQLEAELVLTLPSPSAFGHPLFNPQIAAPWLDADRYVRWHTLSADQTWRGLHPLIPTQLLPLAVRALLISLVQAALAASVLWIAIRGACGGAGGIPVAPLGGAPGGR